MVGLVSWWRERSARARVRAHATHLLKEARRILRRKSYRIPQSVAGTVAAAVDELVAALRGGDTDRQRSAIAALEERMTQHLAFARKSTLREYAESIGVAVFVALLLRAFVVEAFQIPTGSMIPTLEIGDHIFVSKFAYGVGIPFTETKVLGWRQPERGDVIVFKWPDDPVDYIKRVVGLPGDVVRVRRNEILINGKPVPRDPAGPPCGHAEATLRGVPAEETECDRWTETLDGKPHPIIYESGAHGRPEQTFQVPADAVFVMGDNRDNSADSRMRGPVPHNLIKGKALVIWWSRANSEGVWGLSKSWWRSIRWGRFFSSVD